MRKLIWSSLRIALALLFISASLLVIVRFGGNHPPEVQPAAGSFTGALNRSGFMNPLLTADLLLGSFALLFERWAPIGILLLAPPVVVIACFHWFLTHSYVWGTIWPTWLVALSWHYRDVFARLWRKEAAGKVGPN